MTTKTTFRIPPDRVHETIQKRLIGDGFPMVFDLQQSHGSWIVDARNGEEYLDFFSFFASLPLGFHHPAFHTPENAERLLQAAIHKPSNSDAHSPELASFAETFGRVAAREHFPHLFFIEGGTLAVENSLKTAFDWKVRKNLAAGRSPLGTKVIHFREAFHGRSGYCLSITNTNPVKTDYFPKFDWPRITNPKLRFPVGAAENARVSHEEERARREIAAAFRAHPGDIAAIIIETIQAEGGDNHFRKEFLRALREIADREEALLIFDEVQCGFGITGRFWAFEHFQVIPDIVCFGKKSQVCGIMAGPRIDEVKDNVFHLSSRLNSTWGGSLADMVRCEIILETMESERVVENAAEVGARLLDRLEEVRERAADFASNVRGRGLMCAFDCPGAAERDRVIARAREKRLVILPCGDLSVRLRPALNVSRDEVDEAANRLEDAIRAARQ